MIENCIYAIHFDGVLFTDKVRRAIDLDKSKYCKCPKPFYLTKGHAKSAIKNMQIKQEIIDKFTIVKYLPELIDDGR